MIKHYESIQGDHAAIASKLNEVSGLCDNINVVNATAAMFQHPLTNQQTPGLVCLMEFQFGSEQNRNKFELLMRPKKLMTINE